MKNIRIFYLIFFFFFFLVVKFSVYLNRRVFVMTFSLDLAHMYYSLGGMYLFSYTITKTYLYNFDPLKPHFYIVKLGFTGVYTIFLISAQTID